MADTTHEPRSGAASAEALDDPDTPGISDTPAPPASQQGDWKLLRLLGASGIARLYLAVRAGSGAAAQQVVVKLLKQSMGSSEPALQALAAETQTLKRLQHPHIAGLIDAGRSADGLPYLVREYVDGLPIDEACTGLSQQERLQLFLQLADALDHAHRRLILHRRLHPDQVRLIAAPREQRSLGRGRLWGPAAPAAREIGQVKLLGFGSAEPLDELSRETPHSSPYASPEQRGGASLGTATDIYSLGALLYVMLTGPLSAAARGDSDWPAQRQRLDGDLEPILSKAMSPAAEQRYASVDAFAADIRRFLGGQPVSVQPPTPSYVAGRFVQRHRLPVAVAGVAALALLAGVAASLWQAEQALQARAQADTRLHGIRTVTREVVTSYGDAINFLPGGIEAKEGLLKGFRAQLAELEHEAGDDTEWLALLTATYARLAQVQANETGATLDRMADARRNAQRAIELGDRVWAARRHDTGLVAAYALALQVRSQASLAAGKPQPAARDLEEAQRRVDEALSAAPQAERRPLRLRRAALLLAQAPTFNGPNAAPHGTPERAVALLDKADAELQALDAEKPELAVTGLLGSVHGARAIAYTRLNQWDRARDDAAAAVGLRLRALEQEPGNPAWRDALMTAATNQSTILLQLGLPRPALTASELAWAQVQILARENGPKNPWIAALARVAQHHGRALVANGRYQEALPLLSHAAALWQATLMREPNPNARRMLGWLAVDEARAMQGSGDTGAARARARSAIAELTPLAAAPQARDAKLNLGEACSVMASLEPPRNATPWLTCASDAYAGANALQPLGGDALRSFKAAGGAL